MYKSKYSQCKRQLKQEQAQSRERERELAPHKETILRAQLQECALRNQLMDEQGKGNLSEAIALIKCREVQIKEELASELQSQVLGLRETQDTLQDKVAAQAGELEGLRKLLDEATQREEANLEKLEEHKKQAREYFNELKSSRGKSTLC